MAVNRMQLINQTLEGLIDYTCAQVSNFFPDGAGRNIRIKVTKHIAESLRRLEVCINAVRMWPIGQFDYLHSTQYCLYLYFLSNTIWRHEECSEVCSRLFFLNKILNGIDCFYEIELPEIFFIGHSVGVVFAKAKYSNYFVIYQNSTIGKNHGIAPDLGEGLIMYPNTAVIGRCSIKPRTVLSQGVGIINNDTPGECIVFRGEGGTLVFKKLSRDILADIFRF